MRRSEGLESAVRHPLGGRAGRRQLIYLICRKNECGSYDPFDDARNQPGPQRVSTGRKKNHRRCASLASVLLLHARDLADFKVSLRLIDPLGNRLQGTIGGRHRVVLPLSDCVSADRSEVLRAWKRD
jgi:hypothetical protein